MTRWCVLMSIVGCLAVLAFADQQGVQEVGAEYRVGTGDVLTIEVFDEEEISGMFSVENSGAITFPLLGAVPVEGRTTAEIVDVLEELLERDFYVDVQLKVEVSEYGSQPVTLLGEIQSPGTYYLEGATSLTEMLARAGGLKATAGSVLELRRTARASGEGPPQPQTFDTDRLLSGEIGRDTYLQAGDIIFVSPRKLFFITGEIARPGQYEISVGLTLMQAISQAGGVGKFASQEIEIHRFVDSERRILEFDMSQIRKGKVADPPILAADFVFVKRRFF